MKKYAPIATDWFHCAFVAALLGVLGVVLIAAYMNSKSTAARATECAAKGGELVAAKRDGIGTCVNRREIISLDK